MSTLSGQVQLVTPLAESTPITQSSQTPMIPPRRMQSMRDILDLVSTEQARADYLEGQIQHIGSISRPSPEVSFNRLDPQSQDEMYRPQSRGTTPVIENARVGMGQQQMGAVAHNNLQKQVQEHCQKNKTRRKQEWESYRTALEVFRRYKEQQKQQQSQEEQDASYAQLLQCFEWT